MELQNNVVIVTGGASGLGLVTCQQLAAQGAKVVAFDLNEEAGRALVAELGDKAVFAKVDVTDVASVAAGIAKAIEAFGRIDVCINCAGIAPGGKTVGRNGALPLEKFAQVININLLGTFNVLRLAAEQMAKNAPNADGERGVIINTASVAAFDGQVGQAAYSASKAGVVGMTLPIARDLAPLGIRVMTIAPGIFDTPMMKGMADEVRDPLLKMVQSPKRFGEPKEYAALAAHIITNQYLNGEVIRLDGAIRMEPR
ncbi:3-hydroxyacyl-CoA dehydrogenase [Pseudomonas sp. N040]|uniref:3-hydroxyacyl-CoA dehydrogenase n=1 Tax=Pseudomonas sp. N040 TaxID=2785325 RepID=UPI0018A2DD82|nr:3-hydroxyacyl-CoA dehydrogenase [Pseudomonas sp. N040]MBF7729658.1 3-hydroxyacyl-CoA dehydrogenase [Pseudomonas sp. N040]MBW7013300.1 3-hydroxyacyl-CoA dehydrogenase [Pseudomonas sp. N040]